MTQTSSATCDRLRLSVSLPPQQVHPWLQTMLPVLACNSAENLPPNGFVVEAKI